MSAAPWPRVVGARCGRLRRRRRPDGRQSAKTTTAAARGSAARPSRSRSASRPPTTAGSAACRRTPRQLRPSIGRRFDLETTDADRRPHQIETLIQEKPDVLVVLPNEGEPLTPVAQKAMDAGIQVINIDREFSTPAAYHRRSRATTTASACRPATSSPTSCKCKGNVVEIQGIAGISVTEQRSQGFADQIKKRCNDGIKIVAQQPADFAPDKGLTVMENILQTQNKIHAVYTHDDDMGEGVASAIENAGRDDEMWMTGAGGSKARHGEDQGGRPVARDLPLQPGDVGYGRLPGSADRAQRGLPGALAAPDIPRQIILSATTVTKDNVDQFEKYCLLPSRGGGPGVFGPGLCRPPPRSDGFELGVDDLGREHLLDHHHRGADDAGVSQVAGEMPRSRVASGVRALVDALAQAGHQLVSPGRGRRRGRSRRG